MGIRVISGPTGTSVISLAEAKAHLRVEISNEDNLILSLIEVARASAQEITRRAIGVQTFRYSLNGYPVSRWFSLPFAAPLISITSVSAVILDGTTQVFSPSLYSTSFDSEPAIIGRAYNQTWPSLRETPDNFQIVYQAGYTNLTLPGPIKQWMLLAIGTMYANREADQSYISLARRADFVDRLLDKYVLDEIGG